MRKTPTSRIAATLPLKGRRGKPRQWSPMRDMPVPFVAARDGSESLDSTLDRTGYWLMQRGLLPQLHLATPAAALIAAAKSSPEALARLQERVAAYDASVAAAAALQTRVAELVAVPRSVAEASLVIGCDEAGRGPLAGPVVGAAFTRIPLASLGCAVADAGADELFGVGDSKSVTEPRRREAFRAITGYASVFELGAAVTPQRFAAPALLTGESLLCDEAAVAADAGAPCATPLADMLAVPEPHLLCWQACRVDGRYLYAWGIALANHSFIDRHNILTASMECMHRSARAVWAALADRTRLPAALAAAGRPPAAVVPGSVARQLRVHHDRLSDGGGGDSVAADSQLELFGIETVQPPLVLVDGNHCPAPSVDYFTSPNVGGAVHPVVKGDARSFSVAAASNLAKVARDEIMERLGAMFPGYGLAEHKGYPTADHLAKIAALGVSPIHRLSYGPCKPPGAGKSDDENSEEEEEKKAAPATRRKRASPAAPKSKATAAKKEVAPRTKKASTPAAKRKLSK